MGKKKPAPGIPKTEKEIGRRETYMMVSPLHKIDEDWAYHNYSSKDIEGQIEFWDLVHRDHELKGTCKTVRVTIIYEDIE